MRRAALLTALLLAAACASTRTAAPPLRVMTYNIHAGKDATGFDNLERVAALVKAENADIVLLQEVDKNTTRSGGVDQLGTLERLTQLHGAFGKSLDYQGGDYGIAILSRWPVTASEVVPLRVEPPQVRAGGSVEPRVALVVETQTPGGPLTFLDTHIDASRDDRYRLQEAADIARAIAARTTPPSLLGGDLNSTPQSGVHATLRAAGYHDAWLECGKGDGLTFPASLPVKRIDYLYLAKGMRCTSAKVLESQASDHRAVMFEVSR